ncbi:MAG: NACHT domain-containing protein [Candidatus Pseudobacter hemicellulosilyticus]|uniref:NACHT domain-containing protein n=1 Tax=Candidatus Pseudobacter hemicellulosilyticus TaxID=3121375 RepID=A0AAJ6BEE6_9BACT|nr:MAG: NACHT domain-containing protein [Pseudobacter sp.]
MDTSAVLDAFNIRDYVSKYVTKKLLDVAVIGIKNALKRINGQTNTIKLQAFKHEDLIEHITQHLAENIKWASNISFRDIHRAKNIDDVFIELDTYISPIKLRLDMKSKAPSIPFREMLSDTDKNIIILGQPGAGKTTSVKRIFLDVLRRNDSNYEVFNFPIIIRLKDLVFEQGYWGLSLFREILGILGIFYTHEGPVGEQMQEKILIHIFKDFIERLDVLIILDGFDEVGDEKAKNEIVRNLRLMTNSLMNSKFILTSRSSDYNVHIDNTTEYEICPLTEHQIEDFVQKWLNNQVKAKDLLEQLRRSPYWDTTMRPLTLAHLCALYERNNSIPDKPKSVYKKVIQLLLEDWNNQRSIHRHSRYAQFEVDRKIDFLSRFGYELTVEYSQSSFNKRTLELIYSFICTDYNLPESESCYVIHEIESHNGLILQTGAETFEFSHKSLLEYLVADFIVKLPVFLKDQRILVKIPNELAIAIAISSNANMTYFELVCNILQYKILDPSFLQPFLTRILIEKPDFEPNILYSITNIYLLNVIAIGITKDIDEIFMPGNNRSANYKKPAPHPSHWEDLHDQLADEEIIDDFDWEEEDIDEEIEEINDGDDMDKQQEVKINLDAYYAECINIIIHVWKTPLCRKSFEQISTYYNLGDIRLTKKSPLYFFSKFGKMVHLKRKSRFYKVSSINVELPDNLVLPYDFVEIFQNRIKEF